MEKDRNIVVVSIITFAPIKPQAFAGFYPSS